MDIKTELIELGGPVVVILLVLSVIAVTIVVAKTLQFASARVGRHATARKALALWQKGQLDEACSLVANERSLAGALLRLAMEQRRVVDSEHGDTADRALHEDRLREDISARAADRLFALTSWLRALDLIAQIAPLLGLFGTVLGMIEAFQTLQEAGSAVDPSALAGGIWVALLTTACGLAVAIPVSMATTWFEGRLEKERSALEVLLTGVFSTPPVGSR